MKKNEVRTGLIVALLLVVFSVLAFVIPFERTAVFWLGYAFGMVALAAQFPLVRLSILRGADARSWLYGFPIARLGAVYGAVQIVVSLIAMAMSAAIPMRAVIIVEALILAATCIGLLTTTAMREELKRQDKKLETNTAGMRELQSKASALAGQAEDRRMAPPLRKLADELRYSDPVSNEATRELEANLMACLDDMEKAMVDGDADGVEALCKRATATLTERNRVCKLNKQRREGQSAG